MCKRESYGNNLQHTLLLSRSVGTPSKANHFVILYLHCSAVIAKCIYMSVLQNAHVAIAGWFQPASVPICRAGQKRAAHDMACHSEGITFIPLVVESLGGRSSKPSLPSRTLAASGANTSAALLLSPSGTYSDPVACHLPLEGQCHLVDWSTPYLLSRGGWVQ